MARTLPGIRKAAIGRLIDWGDQPAPFYRMTELYWNDVDSLLKAFASPEGQATVKDQLKGKELTSDYIEFLADEEQIIPLPKTGEVQFPGRKMVKYVSIRKLKEGVTPEQYEKYYWEVHIPLSWKIPNVRKATGGRGLPWGDEPALYYRISEVYFDDYETLIKSFASPEAQPAAIDLGLAELTGEGMRFLAEEEQIIP
jgi:uncharacterized protein (TIGR02118 family)